MINSYAVKLNKTKTVGDSSAPKATATFQWGWTVRVESQLYHLFAVDLWKDAAPSGASVQICFKALVRSCVFWTLDDSHLLLLLLIMRNVGIMWHTERGRSKNHVRTDRGSKVHIYDLPLSCTLETYWISLSDVTVIKKKERN